MHLQTHETYVHAVAALAQAHAADRLDKIERATLGSIKLAYGAGYGTGARGITFYDRWGKPDAKAPFVEVCAFGQESIVQLAGTTIHELAHVLTGPGHGHDKVWKDNCKRLGLRLCKAAGTKYSWGLFDPALRFAIAQLPLPNDGAPVQELYQGLPVPARPRSCHQGVGVRGGTSKGKGSGSRLRLFECECIPPVKVRVARDTFEAHCDCCEGPFLRT